MASRARPGRKSDHPLNDAVMVIVLVTLTLAAIGLGFLSVRGHWLDVPRAYVADLLSPARTIVAAPFAGLRQLSGGLREHVGLVRENRRLREENERLRAWYDLSLTMAQKMERYERLLQLKSDPGTEVVSARVIADLRGPFLRARLLNAGKEDGVEVGHAVMTERGFLGLIVNSGEVSSRALLLTDINSRVPVMVARNDVRAIVIGDNTERPRLEFLPSGHGLLTGDRIVTSGDGGVLPRGLPIGEAVADARGIWRVRLYSNDAPFDYARILRFDRLDALEDGQAVDSLPNHLQQRADGLIDDAAISGQP
jgi:rod shape-determining protein MreC